MSMQFKYEMDRERPNLVIQISDLILKCDRKIKNKAAQSWNLQRHFIILSGSIEFEERQIEAEYWNRHLVAHRQRAIILVADWNSTQTNGATYTIHPTITSFSLGKSSTALTKARNTNCCHLSIIISNHFDDGKCWILSSGHVNNDLHDLQRFNKYDAKCKYSFQTTQTLNIQRTL